MSSAEPYCKHDLVAADCADCTGRGLPELSVAEYGRWFAAEYRGRCVCGSTIEPGDHIRADGQGGYLCEGCGQVPA